VRRSQQQMVAAAVRRVFAAAELGEARSHLAHVVTTLEPAAAKQREVVLLTTR